MIDKDSGTAGNGIDDELTAMGAVASALKDLDADARSRVVGWAAQRFGSAGAERRDRHEDESGERNTKGGRRRRAAKPRADSEPAARRPRVSAPTHDKTLNLRPAGVQSFEDFVKEKQPKTNNDRNLVSVSWLKETGGVAKVGPNQVFTCYRDRKWNHPADLRNALQVTASVKGWLNTEDMDDISVVPQGENRLNDLPETQAK